jgi:hypothetical protein
MLALIGLVGFGAAQNGVTATESGTITGSTTFDALWADSADQRWKVNNHGVGAVDMAVWPCTTSTFLGGIVFAGNPPLGSSINTETCLQLVGTTPGVPLLSNGATAPQWGGSLLDLQGWTLASEIPNDTTTGTVINTLAKVTLTGAVQAGTTDTMIPTYIVVAGAGHGVGTKAQLAVSGQASCIMDATITSGAIGWPVFESTATGKGGDCSTSSPSTLPLGVWIVGYMAQDSTTVSVAANVIASSGGRATAQSFSNPTGSELLTASGTLTSGHVPKFNASGDVIDSGAVDADLAFDPYFCDLGGASACSTTSATCNASTSFGYVNGLNSTQQCQYFQGDGGANTGVGLGYSGCSPSSGQPQTTAAGNCSYRDKINLYHGYQKLP